MNLSYLIKNTILALGSLINDGSKSKVLFYHDVCSKTFYKSIDTDVLLGTPIDVFKKHVEHITKNGFSIVPHIEKTEYEVSIMFDDGFRGIWDNRDYFYKRNMSPTVFLAVELIGKPGFLTVDEIRELQDNGFIFECHSWSHVNLAPLSAEVLKKELGDSKEYLSKLLGKEVTELCLPIGYFSDNLLKEIQKYGYNKVYSSIPGNADEKILGCLETRNLCQFANIKEFQYILNGGAHILRNWYFKQHYKI